MTPKVAIFFIRFNFFTILFFTENMIHLGLPFNRSVLTCHVVETFRRL